MEYMTPEVRAKTDRIEAAHDDKPTTIRLTAERRTAIDRIRPATTSRQAWVDDAIDRALATADHRWGPPDDGLRYCQTCGYAEAALLTPDGMHRCSGQHGKLGPAP